MIFKTFVIGMVLVGITVILTELHRYIVYSEEIESVTTLLKDKSEEAEGDRRIGDENLLRSARYQYEDDLSELEALMEELDNE